MSKTLLLLIVVIFATVAAQGQFGQCPRTCECRGFVPGVCTSCNDPLADVGTQCRQCLPQYSRGRGGLCQIGRWTPSVGGSRTKTSGSTILGGITPQTNYNSISGFSEVNSFVLAQKPELVGATITNVSTQIVAGTNYYITYTKGNTVYKVTVWSQPWTNTMTITDFTHTP